MNDKYNLISLLNPFTLNSVINAGKLKMENRVFFLFKSTVPFQNHKNLMKKIYQKHKIASQKFFSLTSALLSSTLSSFFHQSAAVTINSLPCETNENSADYQSLKVSSLWISFIASMLNTHHLLSTGALALDSSHFRSNIKLFSQKNTSTPIFVPSLPLKFLYMRE